MKSSDTNPSPNDAPPGTRPLLRRVDQAAVAVILGVAWLAIVVGLFARGYHRGRLIEIDQAEPGHLTFRLDLNHAEWSELTLLPGIGETLAREIVKSREQDGPFRDYDDLCRRRISGIGPKKLEAMRPHLLPFPGDEAGR